MSAGGQNRFSRTFGEARQYVLPELATNIGVDHLLALTVAVWDRLEWQVHNFDTFCIKSGRVGVLENAAPSAELRGTAYLAQAPPDSKSVILPLSSEWPSETIPAVFVKIPPNMLLQQHFKYFVSPRARENRFISPGDTRRSFLVVQSMLPKRKEEVAALVGALNVI